MGKKQIISNILLVLLMVIVWGGLAAYFAGYRRGDLGFPPRVEVRIGSGLRNMPAKNRYIWYKNEIVWSSFDDLSTLNDSIENQREKEVQYIINLITKK